MFLQELQSIVILQLFWEGGGGGGGMGFSWGLASHSKAEEWCFSPSQPVNIIFILWDTCKLAFQLSVFTTINKGLYCIVLYVRRK